MKNLLVSGLMSLLVLTGCGGSGTPTRHNDFIPLTSITIVAASPSIEATRTIAAKTSTKLQVIGNFSGLFSRDITDQATWATNSPTVAEFITATSPNRVSGHIAGSATLTATVGTLSATYGLTVSTATINSMTISPANPSVASGLTTQFTVTGTFSDTTTQDLTFDATWSADAAGFASVSNDPASKGLAKGLGVGTATITATFDGTPGSAQLVVTAPVLQSIAVTPASSSIAGFSKTQNFTATGSYSDGTTADITTTVTWDSSAKGIATIIATSGVATTVAAGTTTISAILGGISGNTNLSVTALTLTLTSSSQTVAVGGNITFKLTATPAGGTAQDVTSISTWTSSDTNKATVSSTGVVTAVAVGTTTISAVYSGQTATVTITVQ